MDGRIEDGPLTVDGREVVFAFVGAGSVKRKLEKYKEKHHIDNVIFIPYQKKEDLVYSLNAADVHWCVSAKGIKGVSVPSKLYGCLAVQKPGDRSDGAGSGSQTDHGRGRLRICMRSGRL